MTNAIDYDTQPMLALVEDAPTPTTNIDIPGLWLIRPTDVDRLARVLKDAWRVTELWDDEARANPGLWFMLHYTRPFNMLFDVENGAGLVAFIRTIPGWRTQVYAAAWSRRAMGRDDLFTAACRIAMLTHDLLVIDSFVRLENHRSQKATLRNGFKNRGIVPAAQCYNGAMIPLHWNELERATLGLAPPVIVGAS
jgi:RimJ/RimL family protein N-acetyltransferase